jgi:hypothetical protein
MMTMQHPHDEGCLTDEERAAALAAWGDLHAALQPMGALLEQTDATCPDLFRAFQLLSHAFDAFEREIMRAQQIRVLDVTQDPSAVA